MRLLDPVPEMPSNVKERVYFIAGFVVCVWVLTALDWLLGYRLGAACGLYPRTLGGIAGIFFAPFLHYGFAHVLANTIPFVVLGSLVILQGVREFLEVSLLVIVVGGSAVWLLGRPAYHIGASGLVMGYFGFLVARGWYERSFTSAAIALFVLIFYGGTVWSVLPGAWMVSWEMHLFGLLAGVLAAGWMSGDGRERRPS